MQAQKPIQQPVQDYLNEFEAATMTRFSVGTLRNMRSAKRGPRYFKVCGRSVRYRQSDLEAWLGSQPVLTRDSLPEGVRQC